MKPRTCEARVPMQGAKLSANLKIFPTLACKRPIVARIPIIPGGEVSRSINWVKLPDGLIGLVINAPSLAGIGGETLDQTTFTCPYGHFRHLRPDEIIIWIGAHFPYQQFIRIGTRTKGGP